MSNTKIKSSQLIDEIVNAIFPTGTIIFHAASANLPGFLFCDGRYLQRADYPKLFSVIGTTYGYSTQYNFRIPDLRGEFIRCWDAGRNVDPGRSIGSSQADEFKKHQHLFGGDDYIEFAGYTRVYNFNYDAQSTLSGGGAQFRTKDDTSNNGGLETRPRNIALAAYIKT